MQGVVRPRGRLFWKYVVLFAGLVSAALLASGLVELYFSYRENLAALVALQREQAAGAAGKIEAFLRDIERQVGWASQGQIGTRQTVEQRRFEFIRLQRQAPAVTEVSQLDSHGPGAAPRLPPGHGRGRQPGRLSARSAVQGQARRAGPTSARCTSGRSPSPTSPCRSPAAATPA